MKLKKYTNKDVQNIASQKGFKLISNTFEKVTDKCEWECCKCGHKWMAPIRKIKEYKGCPACTGKIYTRERVMSLVGKKNITLLSKNYTTLNKNYKWECNKCKYTWKARASQVVHTSNCPKCSKLAPYTIEELKYIVADKNLKLLDNVYMGMNSKYKCECNACNYVWKVRIVPRTKCPKCSMRNRKRPLIKTIKYARQLAKERGFKLISKTFLGMKKKHIWKCTNGHEWSAVAQNIKRGNNCPTCSKNNYGKPCRFVTEKKVRYIFEQLTGEPFPSDWHTLKNGMQLDGYCEKLNLAFEYQGPQHYHIGYWNNTQEKLDSQIARDNKKTKACQRLKIIKIDVPYTVSQPMHRLQNFVISKFKEHKITIISKCQDDTLKL